jgi:regulator of sirC expression with transglutaminase-like and TPR domain
VTPEAARDALGALLRDRPHPFPIDRAALLLAVEEYPGLDPQPCQAQLDAYAARVETAAAGLEPRRRMAALRRVLFEEEGFHGNRDAYYDLRNSYLNEVLERKLGIPITLAAVMLGVAGRLGWPLAGVSFPLHFLVRYVDSDEPLAADPFHGGLLLGREELEERWRLATGSEPPAGEALLPPATPEAILTRMLNNIRIIHAHHQRFDRAAEVTTLMGCIVPEEPEIDRQAGYFLLRAGAPHRARLHLERYLDRAPQSPWAAAVRQQLEALREL